MQRERRRQNDAGLLCAVTTGAVTAASSDHNQRNLNTLHATMDSAKEKLASLLDELSKANSFPRLSAATHDVDRIIDLLSEAREQIANGELHPTLPFLARHRLTRFSLAQPWIRTRQA